MQMDSFRYFLYHLKSTKCSLEKDANVINTFQTAIKQYGWTRNCSRPRVVCWIQTLMMTQNLTGCNDLQSSGAWTDGESLVGEKNSWVSINPWPTCTETLSDSCLPPHQPLNILQKWTCAEVTAYLRLVGIIQESYSAWIKLAPSVIQRSGFL